MTLDRQRLAKLPRSEQERILRLEIASLDLEERFALLHELGIYHGAESSSGDGSSLSETRALRAALPGLLRRLEVRRLLDVPCGDFHWLATVDLGAVTYVGADIVPALVEDNLRRHGAPGRDFLVLDATRDPLPPADLVLCRDLLIHLGNPDVWRFLANLAGSQAAWLLTTHFGDRLVNPDIVSGDFRPLNLCRPPFLLSPPEEKLDERSTLADGAFADRCLGLWSMKEIRRAVAARGWSG